MKGPERCEYRPCGKFIPKTRRNLGAKFCRESCADMACKQRRMERINNRCPDCGDLISEKSTRCRYCASEARRKYKEAG